MTKRRHPPTGLDLSETYVDLADGGGAETVTNDAAFWQDLMSGRRDIDRLMGVAPIDKDWTFWEQHPNGEEVLVLLAGAATLVLDDGTDDPREVSLEEGQAVVVPRGTWHRMIVHRPGRMVFVTAGRGTTHRPHEATAE